MNAAIELARSLADESLVLRQSFLSLPDGRHNAVPEDVYHAPVLGVASSSSITRILRSPAHYRASLEGRKETPSLHLGRAIHCYLLEPERFARTYVVAPECDRRTKEGKATYAAFTATLAPGAEILKPAEFATVRGIAESVAAHPIARQLLAAGLPEVTAKWTDKDTGIVCRSRSDFYHPDLGIIVDVKSTTDARSFSFSRAVQEYGYHRQDAHYTDGHAAIGEPVEDFVFLVAEKDPPYAVSLFQLEADERREGLEEVQTARRVMAECLAKDEWPAYATGIQRISRPEWARKSER